MGEEGVVILSSAKSRISYEANVHYSVCSLRCLEEASIKAISAWGRSRDHITHMVLCTPDDGFWDGQELLRLLKLNPAVITIVVVNEEGFCEGRVLLKAKEIAEHEIGSRVLGICQSTRPSSNVVKGYAAIVGCGSLLEDVEKRIFRMWFTSQSMGYVHSGMVLSDLSHILRKNAQEFPELDGFRVVGSALTGILYDHYNPGIIIEGLVFA